MCARRGALLEPAADPPDHLRPGAKPAVFDQSSATVGVGQRDGVAIHIPRAFTVGLGATPSVILLTSVYYGAMYGGRISSILLNIPGDEPAMMTCLDGHPMAKRGMAGEAAVDRLWFGGERPFASARAAWEQMTDCLEPWGMNSRPNGHGCVRTCSGSAISSFMPRTGS